MNLNYKIYYNDPKMKEELERIFPELQKEKVKIDSSFEKWVECLPKFDLWVDEMAQLMAYPMFDYLYPNWKPKNIYPNELFPIEIAREREGRIDMSKGSVR